jgi:hypothetical protein
MEFKVRSGMICYALQKTKELMSCNKKKPDFFLISRIQTFGRDRFDADISKKPIRVGSVFEMCRSSGQKTKRVIIITFFKCPFD